MDRLPQLNIKRTSSKEITFEGDTTRVTRTIEVEIIGECILPNGTIVTFEGRLDPDLLEAYNAALRAGIERIWQRTASEIGRAVQESTQDEQPATQEDQEATADGAQ